MDENELNEKWNISNVIKEAIQSAHINPSPATLEMFTEMREHTKELKEDIKIIKQDTKDTLVQAIKTNGRVSALEKDNIDIKDSVASYKRDRVRVITFGAVLIFLGSTVIALGLMALDGIINDKVDKKQLTPEEIKKVVEQTIKENANIYENFPK